VAAQRSMRVIEQILAAGLKGGQVVSVNLPAVPGDQAVAGVRVVRQCTRPWADTYEKRTDPRGREYFWNSSVFRETPRAVEPKVGVRWIRPARTVRARSTSSRERLTQAVSRARPPSGRGGAP